MTAPVEVDPAAAPAARPTRPDENAFKEELAKAEKEHKAAMDNLNAIKAKIDAVTPGKNKTQANPILKRRQELIAQLTEIRQKQAGGKNARMSKLDQIKRLDEQLRGRVNEQKVAKAKVPFKNVEDVDRQIASLEKQVNAGTMKLVEEKKALADISNMRKVRKNFSQLDESQKQIDDMRAKIKEIKDSMDDSEQKALSEQYNKVQAELDIIKAEQDEAYKSLSLLRDERTKLQAEQQGKFSVIRKLKDDYYTQKKAFQTYEREAREKHRERQRLERERHVQERKKADAERVLAEASEPAYLDEIRRASGLLVFLDPTFKSEKTPLVASSGLTAQAQRTVAETGFKGIKLVRKEDRDGDYLPAQSKGKKGKKGNSGGAAQKGFNCPPSLVEDCTFLNIEPPMRKDDVPGLIEKVKAKLEHWKEDQAAQTQRNIEKAKKKLEELEKGEANGDKVEEVAAVLQDASLEDKEKHEEA
ncbi:nuclear segregation bfr1 [Trichoderma cornu-damae]|uniref:Nuclear segregation bfr1 n=1 Tax=Trichoderma cornu-damae TaxID=654480 RepID=A0A9P8QRS2_9HYPO|nr:nuclear segregation bfr1 [Trichoderma cornu-damae]